MKKLCQYRKCDTVFILKRINQKYCSEAHNNAESNARHSAKHANDPSCAYRLCAKFFIATRKDQRICISAHAQAEKKAGVNGVLDIKTCAYKKCHKMFYPLNKNQKYHSSTCEQKARYKDYAKETKKKKLAEEQRVHGMDADTAVIYENYKQPLKQVENGFGYMGTVALTEDRQKVQCHICGWLYESLAPHINSKHKITTRQYKEKFRLGIGTALIGDAVREQRITAKNAAVGKKGLPVWLEPFNKPGINKGIANTAPGGYHLERRNKEGLCPDQVLEKIKELADKLGRTPSHDEFVREHSRYRSTIVYYYGSWNNAVKRLGMIPVGDIQKVQHSPEYLLECMQDFYKRYKRPPMTSDFRRGLLPNRGHYYAKFGGLNNARVEAGIPAVIPLPYHQYVEIAPEDYARYLKGEKVGTLKQDDRAFDKRIKRDKNGNPSYVPSKKYVDPTVELRLKEELQ